MSKNVTKIPWHKRIYTFYKGEVFICDGTIREISKITGKTINHLRFMTNPCYGKRCEGGKNRQLLILLDEE